MGQYIEEYSWEELGRIRVPGRSVPALFWALPVGEWEPAKLNEFWDYFVLDRLLLRKTVRQNSICRKLGLLLVKNHRPPHKQIDSSEDLKITASLKELLPRGVVGRNASQREPGIIILGGNFPQPGWGVTINNPRLLAKPRWLDDFLENVCNNIFSEHSGDLDSLISASELHYDVKNSQFGAVANSAAKIIDANSAAKVIESRIQNVLDYAGDYQSRWSHFKSLIQCVQSHIGNNTFPEGIPDQIVENIEKACDSSWERKIQAAIKLNAGEKASTFHPDLVIKLNESSVFIENLTPEWIAEQIKEWQTISSDLVSQLTKHFESISGSIKKRYSEQLIRCTEILDRLVPRFLFEIEKELNLHSDRYNSINGGNLISSRSHQIQIWDAPRMVGWKLDLLGYSVNVQNLASAINSLPTDGVGNNSRINRDQIHEGLQFPSVFTDYVHFALAKNPNKIKRDVAKHILLSIYNFEKFQSIFTSLIKNQIEIEAELNTHADNLLTILGWPNESLTKRPKPLCLFVDGNIDPVELRISTESFCKDFLMALIGKGQLGLDSYGEIEVNDFSLLMLDKATQCFRKLFGPPNLFDDSHTLFIDSINRIARFANPHAHHNSDSERLTPFNKTDVNILLEFAKSKLGEMPWHFFPLQQVGDIPRILVGTGWSHSCASERPLYVLTHHPSEKMDPSLVYNPSGVNPVMADAVFLNAPYQID